MPTTTDAGTWALLNALVVTLAKRGILTDAMFAEILDRMQSLHDEHIAVGDPVGAREVSETSGLIANAIAAALSHDETDADDGS